MLYLLAGVTLLVVISNVVGHALNAPGHSGPGSDHFDGRYFRNHEDVRLPNFLMGLRYLLTTRPGRWDTWRELEAVEPPPERVGPNELRATYVNHATTLVQIDGKNVLTDPIWGDRASPFSWAGPRRRHPPGIAWDALPPIDVVLLSHNHYDHLNEPTIKRLAADHDATFVTGLGNGPLLERLGIEKVRELDWGERVELGSITIVGQPARHFSGRGFSDRQRTLWMSFVIEGPGGPVYFGGDTSYGTHFADTARECGPMRLAILPIGAYAPRWFMGSLHLNPAEAVRAHLDLGARHSLAMHYGTFRLSEEGQDDPVSALREALAENALTEEAFWLLSPGEGRSVTHDDV